MKKVIVVLAIVLIIGVFASGCRKSIGDRIAENIVEDLTGGEVDISGDGEAITIETEEGSFSVGDTMAWPDGLMGNLAELNATILSVVDSGENGCTVIFCNMAEADAQQYVQSLKDLGYTVDAMDLSDEESICHMGNNQNGDMVSFICTAETGEGTVFFKQSN